MEFDDFGWYEVGNFRFIRSLGHLLVFTVNKNVFCANTPPVTMHKKLYQARAFFVQKVE